MSSLWCVGNGDFIKYRMRNRKIKDIYFKKYNSISTDCIENVFKELPTDMVDNDVVDAEVNDVRPTDAEKEEAFIDGLFVNCKSQGKDANDDDDFEHHVIHELKVMIAAQEPLVGDVSSSKLKKKKTIEFSEHLFTILCFLYHFYLLFLMIFFLRFLYFRRHLELNEEILKRLAEIEMKLQSNEEILKRLAKIEAKVE
ncbi:hypothetical protein Adt_20721 [Abeliophyllum distichum]|uniref:Uncharacterized protein n=1 Tax=Abeliophyllum distichum TaxID=126358 RepID=A0ABD1SXF1_9LAMI